MDDLAEEVFETLAKAIVAFEMAIEKIEGNFKLGQNRSRAGAADATMCRRG